MSEEIKFKTGLGVTDGAWKCPECGMEGTYLELRAHRDSGVDSCPQCSAEVECQE